MSVFHFDEIDGVQPSDAAGHLGDLVPPAGLVAPLRAAGIVGWGRVWTANAGLQGEERVAGAHALRRSMTVEAIVYANGDGTRRIIQRGANDGSDAERILWGLELVTASGIGILRLYWQDSGGGDASVPTGSFYLPPGEPWLYVAAVRRWISVSSVAVDYYVNGDPIGTVSCGDGDITAGDGGTTLIGVIDGSGTPAAGMIAGDIIDELRISNGERTAEELRQVFRRLFVFASWGSELTRSLLPPGDAYSKDPSSAIQREVAVEGDGLAHAWHLTDELAEDFLPDRATQTLDRWESITRISPRPGDFYGLRRERVLAFLRKIHGYSRAKIADAIAPLLGVAAADVLFTENGNRFNDDFSAVAIDPMWTLEPNNGVIAQTSGALTLSFATGQDVRWDDTHELPVRVRRGLGAYDATEVYASITAKSLTNVGDVAGVYLWDWTTHDSILFGIHWDGSAYHFVLESRLSGVHARTVLTTAVPGGTVYLRLRHNGDNGVDSFYSTVGVDGPWTALVDGVAGVVAPSVPYWAGVALACGGASSGGASSVSFGDVRIWMPKSRDVYRWYVTTALGVPAAPDARAAQLVIDAMKPAHTQGVIFGSLFLCDDPNSLTDNDVLGS